MKQRLQLSSPGWGTVLCRYCHRPASACPARWSDKLSKPYKISWASTRLHSQLEIPGGNPKSLETLSQSSDSQREGLGVSLNILAPVRSNTSYSTAQAVSPCLGYIQGEAGNRVLTSPFLACSTHCLLQLHPSLEFQ